VSVFGGFPRRRKEKEFSGEQNSLFGEILDWMLAPLLFLWPISIAVTHHVANNIANAPYDQALAENLKVISRLVQVRDAGVSLSLPTPARALLHADEDDSIFFQVALAGGALIAGDNEIPAVRRGADMRADTVYFRDEEIHGEEIRVAYKFMRPSAQVEAPTILVQVAETRNKRSNLAGRIVSGILLPQFATIPLAVILVYVGLGRGIAPLHRLRRLIQRRRPSDLQPISMTGIPEEVRPLILAFNDMMSRLEQNLQAQQRFIADAAHQMRTPLTGLKMQTDLALTESDPEQMQRSLRQIAQSADRAAHLINQLLALARAEASFEKIHAVETFDLERVLQDVSREFVPRALQKGIDFGLEVTGWPLMVDGNPLMLRELVKNLIDNAIKYTPSGGKVTVRAVASEFAILEVEDNGIGIAENERELVFERFYRVLGSGADGSGLGLAIVREIAELHRANVVLKPHAHGNGTLAQVFFPRHRPRPQSLPIDDEAAPALSLRRSESA
jgi:two-component system sensor histidine kinase TctE